MTSLSPETTENDLWEFFGDCGTIEYIILVRDPSTYASKKLAMIVFKGKTSVKNAMKKSGSSLKKQKVEIRPVFARPEKEKELQPTVKQTREEYLLEKRKAKEGLKKLLDFGGQLQTNKEIERVFQSSLTRPQLLNSGTPSSVLFSLHNHFEWSRTKSQ